MPQQVKILGVVFVILVAALAVARYLLVPPTFGEHGHYRTAAIDAVISQPVRYAGQQVCLDCHDDIVELKQESWHRTVSCEVCHGPSAIHADDPDAAMPPAPRERGYCVLCHGYNPSRPTGFPQIDPLAHNPMKPCFTCHDPHQPTTPNVPQECSACHGQIARTKAVSHHVGLSCIRCHEADEEHKVNPRQVRPSKPRTRALCGGCHASGADNSREIPRVSMATHGNSLVCWQCHYPHHPEVE